MPKSKAAKAFIMPSQSEIDDVLNWCAEGMDKGTHYRAMSFEEGVDAAIRWLTEGRPRPDKDE